MKTSSPRHKYILAALIAHSFSSVLAGFVDQLPPPPRPNDISGTVNGCAKAILDHDIDQDGAIRREEYLSFVNNVADLLCLPPRPELDLELQTVFVSIACLCQEIEGNDVTCCFGEEAGLYDEGASSLVDRTQTQESYLRAACLLTQAVLGPEQCELPSATLAPWAVTTPVVVPPVLAPAPLEEEPNSLLWLLLLLLLPVFCCISCCVRRAKEVQEEDEVMIKEETIVLGPGDLVNDQSVTSPDDMEPDVEQALSLPSEAPISVDRGVAFDIAIDDIKSDLSGGPFSTSDGDDDDEEDGNGIPPSQVANISPITGGAPGVDGMEDDEEDKEDIGRALGAKHGDDNEEDERHRFQGQGMLPMPPGTAGVLLRPVVVEPTQQGEYTAPARSLDEYKYRSEDTGQVLDHYIPDGGVYGPQRPPKAPVVMPMPKYKRKPKPEKVYIDPREKRKQLGLGDGEVWDALSSWEEVEEKRGTVPKIDWVIHSALTAFSAAEDTGELMKEYSSDGEEISEVSDDEEEYQA